MKYIDYLKDNVINIIIYISTIIFIMLILNIFNVNIYAIIIIFILFIVCGFLLITVS